MVDVAEKRTSHESQGKGVIGGVLRWQQRGNIEETGIRTDGRTLSKEVGLYFKR